MKIKGGFLYGAKERPQRESRKKRTVGIKNDSHHKGGGYSPLGAHYQQKGKGV